jgi:putative ABC transport system substrate-binding protein
MRRLAATVPVLLTVVLVFASAAAAQPAPKVARIGMLCAPLCNTVPNDAFLDELRKLGWVEGTTIVIERKHADYRLDQLPALAAELVQSKPDLIVATFPQSARAAKDATSEIPIAFFWVADPVGMGLASSLAHPGGNVTGITADASPDVFAKQVQLFKEALPKLGRLAILLNPDMQADKIQSYVRMYQQGGIMPTFALAGLTFWLIGSGHGLVALALSVPMFRLTEHSFAMGTLGFALVTQIVATNWVDFTRGPLCVTGIPKPQLGALRIATLPGFYWMGLAAVGVVGLLYHGLTTFRLGRAFHAVRDGLGVGKQGTGIEDAGESPSREHLPDRLGEAQQRGPGRVDVHRHVVEPVRAGFGKLEREYLGKAVTK